MVAFCHCINFTTHLLGRQVDTKEGEKRAKKVDGAEFLEVSAKTGKHIDEFLKQVSQAAIEALLGGRLVLLA